MPSASARFTTGSNIAYCSVTERLRFCWANVSVADPKMAMAWRPSPRPVQAPLVGHEGGTPSTGRVTTGRLEPGEHLLGVTHLRHPLRGHERRRLDRL